MPPIIDILCANCDTSEELLTGIVEPLRLHFGKALRLVIVDDCSQPHDLQNLKDNIDAPHELRIHPHRMGVTATFNHLLAEAKSQYQFLANSDLVFHDCKPLYELADALDTAQGKAFIGTAEGPRFLDEQAKPYTLTPTEGDAEPWIQDYSSACAVMLQTSKANGALSFDTAFSPGYYEDSALAYSARSRGFSMIYCPTRIHHLGNTAIIRAQANRPAGTTGVDWPAVKERNRLRFLERWGAFLHPRVHTYAEARDNWHRTQHALQRKGTP